MHESSASGLVIEATGATFQKEVLDRSRDVPVVVDFWAPWCGPCRMLGPVLEGLVAEARGEWVLVKVNTDQDSELSSRMGIQGIPAVKAFRDGKVVDEFVGALPESKVREWLKKLVPSAADRAVAEARACMGEDPSRAEALFRQAMEADPNNGGARIGLAGLLAGAGRVEDARTLLEGLPLGAQGVDPGELAAVRLRLQAGNGEDLEPLQARLTANPSDLDARFDLAMALAARQRHEDALGHLLDIVQRDRTFRDDGARKAMIDLFEAVGSRSELADTWREKLARALFR
jgi:putative thioredoxin